MTCPAPCGFQMCYICRSDIGATQGYAHFCTHFRADPGTPCQSCTRCLLFADENVGDVLRLVEARAEEDWELGRV